MEETERKRRERGREGGRVGRRKEGGGRVGRRVGRGKEGFLSFFFSLSLLPFIMN